MKTIDLILLLAITAIRLPAGDWPQLLGPTRDAVYAGNDLATEWPPNGPRVVWSKAVGQGYSSPVVGAGKVILAHRPDEDLVVDCFDAATGKELWQFTEPMKFTDGAFFDSGPRPTPAIKDGKVYVHNTDGHLYCLRLADGKKLWSQHTRSKFGSSATWHGSTASPLVEGQAVFLNVGGTNNAGIVAFDKDTGAVLWQATSDKPTCSSPILAPLAGRTQLLTLTRSGLCSLDPAGGQELWRVPLGRQSSGNVYAASPVIIGDQVFISGWYKLGAALLQVSATGAKPVWQQAEALSTHYANAIPIEGYLYGFHGHGWEQGGPNLRCLELATGKLQWEEPKSGSGTIVRGGDNLLILRDTGELQLAQATPKEFKIKSRAQLLARTVRSYPALADGLAYLKGPRQLVCVDLRRPN